MLPLLLSLSACAPAVGPGSRPVAIAASEPAGVPDVALAVYALDRTAIVELVQGIYLELGDANAATAKQAELVRELRDYAADMRLKAALSGGGAAVGAAIVAAIVTWLLVHK